MFSSLSSPHGVFIIVFYATYYGIYVFYVHYEH